jgi:hypothetical protein
VLPVIFPVLPTSKGQRSIAMLTPGACAAGTEPRLLQADLGVSDLLAELTRKEIAPIQPGLLGGNEADQLIGSVNGIAIDVPFM